MNAPKNRAAWGWTRMGGAFVLGLMTACGGGTASGAADVSSGSDVPVEGDGLVDGSDDAATSDADGADAVDPFAGAPAKVCRAAAGWDGTSALF